MKKYTIATFGFIAVVATWACNQVATPVSSPTLATPRTAPAASQAATAPTARAGTDPLAGLQGAIRKYSKPPDQAEERRLNDFENRLRNNLRAGWKPPWAGLTIQLTDKQIRALPTAELGKRLFDTGLPARTLMLYESPNYGIRRLEVLYKGYKNLFLRPDCWKGLVAAIYYYSTQLDIRAEGTANVNAIAGLRIVPEFYSYPSIRAAIIGHEREIIAAHVRALKKLSNYLNIAIASPNEEKSKPFFASMAPSALINWGLVLGRRLSEQEYEAACDSLSNTKWAEQLASGDMKSFIDQAIIELGRFTRLCATTQSSTDDSHPTE